MRETLDLCADSAEYSADVTAPVLACGNYELLDDGSKIGAILFYRGKERIQTISTPAVFDLKWSHQNPDLLAMAAVDGGVRLYSHADSEMSLFHTYFPELGVNTPALSLDWNTRQHNNPNPSLAVSRGDGTLCVCQLTQTSLETSLIWNAHDYEVWIAAFDSHSPGLLYSGSDDCHFKLWDLREDTGRPVFNDTTHQMGVCSIQDSLFDENLLVTGSYDENVRLWDKRNMISPLSTCNVGGGVWRLKWNPSATHKDLIASASMPGGASILKVTEALQLETTFLYTAHQSLTYGIDWDPAAEGGIASCSFYDKQLHFWNIFS